MTATECAQCDAELKPSGPSLDYCSARCQRLWQATGQRLLPPAGDQLPDDEVAHWVGLGHPARPAPVTALHINPIIDTGGCEHPWPTPPPLPTIHTTAGAEANPEPDERETITITITPTRPRPAAFQALLRALRGRDTNRPDRRQ